MYFITPKTSDTGQKFKSIWDKIDLSLKAQKDLAKELGFYQWRLGYFKVAGGISSVSFKKEPDKKVWKNVNGAKDEWMPKKNTKEGSNIYKKMEALPSVSNNTMNKVIGLDDMFKTIGFARNEEKEYYGFTIKDYWDIKIPDDCEEVLASRYNQLFRK